MGIIGKAYIKFSTLYVEDKNGKILFTRGLPTNRAKIIEITPSKVIIEVTPGGARTAYNDRGFYINA